MSVFEVTPADIEAARSFCDAEAICVPRELARFAGPYRGAERLSEAEAYFLDVLLEKCIATVTPLEFVRKITIRTANACLAIEWAKAFVPAGADRLHLKDIITARGDGHYDIGRLCDWASWVGDRDEMEQLFCSRPVWDLQWVAAWAAELGFRRRPQFSGYVNPGPSPFSALECLVERECGGEYVQKARNLSRIESTMLYRYELMHRGVTNIPDVDLTYLRNQPYWRARFGERSDEEIAREAGGALRAAPIPTRALPYRFCGWGYRWIRHDSLLDRVLLQYTPEKEFEARLHEAVIAQLAHPPRFQLAGLDCAAKKNVSVNVFCDGGAPFSTYVLVDSADNSVRWCEVFAAPKTAPAVRLLDEHSRPSFSPVSWHVTELLPGLRLWAIAPPQSKGLAMDARPLGAAVIATRLLTHRRADHGHAPGEKGGGALYHPDDSSQRRYLDDVYFHGEVVEVESGMAWGKPVLVLQCQLDCGEKGRLVLPVLTAAPREEQYGEKPIQRAEYVHGLGSLQVFPRVG
jgi:hypothetical protein